MSMAVWEITIAVLLAVLAFDLALAIIRRNKETSMREASIWTAFYVGSAIIFCICWSIASHFLNIDAPGKAKIYFIHWFIFSGIFVASLFGITFFFVLTSSFGAAQYLSRTGITILFVVPIIFYFIVYLLFFQ